jgi:hypothetical protein
LVIAEDNQRLTWPECELMKQLDTKPYDARPEREVRHG